MSVVRRGSAGVVVAGLVLLGGPAWAQEDPCAPGPDGAVPERCQSDMPVSDTGTVGMEPEEPCPGLPFEPGDGVVGDEGVAVGEPGPGTPSDVQQEPVPEGETAPPQEEQSVDGPAPGVVEEQVYCIAASGPVADGVPASESAAGGGAAEQLPRTGPYDRLLALTAVGSGLLVVGAGAIAAGRRRRV